MKNKKIKVIYGSAGNQIGTFYKCFCCKYYLDKEGIKRHQVIASNHFKKTKPTKETIPSRSFLWDTIITLIKRINKLEEKFEKELPDENEKDLGELDFDFDINKDAELEPARMIECENCGEEYDDGSPHKCDDEETADIIDVANNCSDREPWTDTHDIDDEEVDYEPSGDFCWSHKTDHSEDEWEDDCRRA